MNFKKYFSNAICSSALRKGRGVGLVACCLFLVCISWSCSSEEVDVNSGLTHSTFTEAEVPEWSVDMTYSDPFPEWEEPESYAYECSMSLLVLLSEELIPYSNDDDRMAVFINGTCRGISQRNVDSNDSSIVFLIYAKGSSEEVSEPMELRYYSGGNHQIFISNAVPPFTPNNILDNTFAVSINSTVSSTKFPYYSEVGVELPDDLPFTVSDGDQMAVFVGNECRGVFIHNENFFPAWRGEIMQREQEEQGYVRYYSAEMGGIYTFSDTFTLNEQRKTVYVAF
ncbi:MAG: hypothetical protein K6F94_01700 [Bacteroidaceae bacterium]|nr:hypothetical protein [Bacteroidaceae bacterium]